MPTELASILPLADELLSRIEERTALVAIAGLGPAGLALAERFAQGGYPVLGFDIDADKAARLAGYGHIEATSDPSRLADADAVIICILAPLDETGAPDLSGFVTTAIKLRPHLRPGQLIVLESPTFPGATENLLLPLLEKSGLEAGCDYYVACSPQVEDPTNNNNTTHKMLKVIGGLDDTSRQLALALYEPIVPDVSPVSSTRRAEAECATPRARTVKG